MVRPVEKWTTKKAELSLKWKKYKGKRGRVEYFLEYFFKILNVSYMYKS